MEKQEMVDVVDANDNVLYAVTKEEAHRKGYLHRTVIAELKNKNNEWILVKQAPDRQDKGLYVSPVGGHVRSGETLEDALKREVLEEIGITDFTYTYIDKAVFYREVLGRKENHLFILFEVFSDNDIRLNGESVGYKRFTTQQLKKELRENPEKFGKAFHFVVRTFYRNLLG